MELATGLGLGEIALEGHGGAQIVVGEGLSVDIERDEALTGLSPTSGSSQ